VRLLSCITSPSRSTRCCHFFGAAGRFEPATSSATSSGLSVCPSARLGTTNHHRLPQVPAANTGMRGTRWTPRASSTRSRKRRHRMDAYASDQARQQEEALAMTSREVGLLRQSPLQCAARWPGDSPSVQFKSSLWTAPRCRPTAPPPGRDSRYPLRRARSAHALYVPGPQLGTLGRAYVSGELDVGRIRRDDRPPDRPEAADADSWHKAASRCRPRAQMGLGGGGAPDGAPRVRGSLPEGARKRDRARQALGCATTTILPAEFFALFWNSR